MRTFIVIFILWTGISLNGQSDYKALILNQDNGKEINITEYATLLIDDTGTLGIEDVQKLEADFIPFDSIAPYDFPTAHWLKLDVLSHLDSLDKWIVFTNEYPEYHYLGAKSFVDAYYIKNDLIVHHEKTGKHVPKEYKSIKENALVNVIPLSFNHPDSLTLFIRVQDDTDPFSTHLSLSIIDPNPFVSLVPNNDTIEVLGSMGAYTIIGIYVLFFFVATRRKAYLFFGLFALVMAFHYLFLEPIGWFINAVIPNAPFLNPLLFSLVIFSYPLILLFGRYFTDLPNRFPKWDKYLILVIFISSIWGVKHILSNIYAPYSERTLLFFIVLILLFPLCVKLVWTKHFQSKVFAFGIFWLIFWNAMGMFWNFGIINLPFIPWTLGQFGFLLIYGIGLGYDLMHSEKEKVEAKQVLELESIKSKFFANISHEFRTPLSLILGPINQIYDTAPASENLGEQTELTVKSKQLNVMKRNALRLQNLVDQLLDLSKLDSGKMNLQLSKGKVIQFIRSIVFSFESLADRKHIQFVTSFIEEIDDAYYDADKLEKILFNLLSNAFKFTPEHGRISVIVDKSDNNLKVAISDSGSGINQSDLNLIFDRFYQTDDTESKGTGIGLALVKELVDLHGGVISVSSTKDQGTTFKVVLPFRKDHFDEKQIKESVHQMDNQKGVHQNLIDGYEKEERRPQEKKENLPMILLVEDNNDLRNYISEGLGEYYEVIVTKDGLEGKRSAINKVPDLIVSDVMMPRMNGIDLCRELKTNEKTSHIPVILLTAKAGIENKIEGLRHGADDYLTKPFEMKELKARVENLINQRKSLRAKYQSELKIRPTEIQLTSMDERFLTNVMGEIERNMSNEYYTVEDLASAVGFSRSQLNRKIKALTDKTTNQLIREFRLTRAKEMLEQGAGSVSEIAYEVGYSNLSYFTKSFKEAYGILPSEVKMSV